MIKAMLLAGCGGFVGTCGRYLVGKWCSGIFHGAFPMGTFMVNLIGCFLIGLFFGLLEKAHVMTPGENVLLITGFCGGFTTFSSFADDMWVPVTRATGPRASSILRQASSAAYCWYGPAAR